MDIRGPHKDIVGIRLGHESESYSLGWLMYHKDEDFDAGSVCEAYNDGFEQGIKFLANYLKEYNIDVEIHDEKVITTDKDDWYSGEIINTSKTMKEKWIKTSTVLPKHEKNVLVYGPTCDFDIAYYSVYCHRWINIDNEVIHPTHWQELEKPE